VLNSIFSNDITSFLKLRKMIVCEQSFKHDTATLTSLDAFLTDQCYCENDLSEEVIDTWKKTLSGKSKTQKEKILSVRNFIKYLNGMGGHSFLPDVPKVKSDYIPYIFSDEEILSLIHHADNLEIKSLSISSPYLAVKIPMVLRILYGCGTRLTETLALQRKDIDFNNCTIFLRKTKFSKERLIPVHDSLLVILERYCLTLGIMLSPDAFLFPGRNPERPFTSRQMAFWFEELLRITNIDQVDKEPHARRASLHCLRHLFVLKSMQQLEAAGHSVDMNDLLLPTYLGHECLLDTDKYMRFSGALVPESLEAFEAFTAGIIPNVEAPYEEE